MNDDNAKSLVVGIIKILETHNVKIQKVLLHKFIYFLSTQNVVKEFRFEPYTYGPYSFDLASTLGSLCFWDAIKETKSHIEVINLDGYDELDEELRIKVENLLRDFQEIVGDFVFNRLECVGTVLYCVQALNFQNLQVTGKTVLEEFKQWKGDRYPDNEVLSDFEKLKPFISAH